jgi:hypothetical protein
MRMEMKAGNKSQIEYEEKAEKGRRDLRESKVSIMRKVMNIR